jgi:hypothetical protein
VKVRACRWREPSGIWSARNFGEIGPTVECCLPPALGRALPLLSTQRVAIAALGASATAISVSRMVLGDAAQFHVEALAYGGVAPNSSQFNGCRPCTTLIAQFDRSLRLLSSSSQDFVTDFAREQRPSVSIGVRYF